MFLRPRVFWLIAAVAALATSCNCAPSSGALCNPSTCAGCCDGDVCVVHSGQSDTKCGSHAVCAACGTGLTCSAGACVMPGDGGGSANGGGSAGTGGGASSSGGGASSVGGGASSSGGGGASSVGGGGGSSVGGGGASSVGGGGASSVGGGGASSSGGGGASSSGGGVSSSGGGTSAGGPPYDFMGGWQIPPAGSNPALVGDGGTTTVIAS